MIAFNSLTSYKFALTIHHAISDPFSLQPRLPDHPKDQFRIEPFPGPRGHPLVIEEDSDLATIHTTLFQPKNEVNQGFVCEVNVDPKKCFGLDRNPYAEVVFHRLLKLLKGKSEITPPSHSSPNS